MIDPVRYLSNRSSGKMGYAIVKAALASRHEVVLVSGPVALSPSDGAEVVSVESAEDMYDAVAERIGGVDAAVMTAAVADYRPAKVSDDKIKKSGERLVLELERTRDILGSARDLMAFDGVLVGFAAETGNIEAYARGKLERKGCDFIVANDVSQEGIGFQSDQNEVTVFYRNGSSQHLPRASKKEIGESLVKIIEGVLVARRAGS
jgi:phosphopantothenoylcysteine synthetase/decarboxylase